MIGHEVKREALRMFIRSAYKKKRKPGSVFYKYRDTFGEIPNCSDYLGAIFGDNPSQENKAEYLQFLKTKYPHYKDQVNRFYLWEFKELPQHDGRSQSQKFNSKESDDDPRFKHYMSWYVILGVPKNADLETIKSAWRELAKVYHPDLPTGNLSIMQAINSAYDYARNLHSYRK